MRVNKNKSDISFDRSIDRGNENVGQSRERLGGTRKFIPSRSISPLERGGGYSSRRGSCRRDDSIGPILTHEEGPVKKPND